MQIKYETEKKEEENIILKEIDRKKTLFVLISGVFLFITLLLLVFLWRLINTKKKINIELRNKNLKITVQNTMITEQKHEAIAQSEKINKQDKLIQKSEEKYKAILTNMDDIFYRTNLNQEHTIISQSALEYTNYERIDDLIGKKINNVFFYNPADINKLIKELNTNKGKVTNFEILLKGKDGQPIPFETNSHYIYNNKKIVGIEGVLRNITERKETEYILIKSKEKIEKAHKDITDSINYAQTIQKSLLTNKKLIDSYIDEYFLLFKPKEIVSGDFYYINKIDKYIVIGIADCTGHGVPGGFLTMIGITYLHEIIRRDKTNNPGEALDILRDRFKKTFLEFGSHNNNGLDIALSYIDTETSTLQYAGAYNPLILIRNNELIEYKATNNPIGFYPHEESFETRKILLQEDDKIYLYTDGFRDQFGGEYGKKYMSKRFKNLLLMNHKYSMKTQKELLIKTFDEWRKQRDQIDDILIFGMRFNKKKSESFKK